MLEQAEKACNVHLNDLKAQDYEIEEFNSDLVVRIHYAMYLKSSLLDGPIDYTYARGRAGGNGQGRDIKYSLSIGLLPPRF